MIIDPVCGTQLDGFEYPGEELYKDRLYFFDSLLCAQRFRADPAKYAEGHEDLGQPLAEGRAA